MRATVMFGAGDVRIEDVPDARILEPTDAVAVNAPGVEVTAGGAAAFIEDATRYSILGRR